MVHQKVADMFQIRRFELNPTAGAESDTRVEKVQPANIGEKAEVRKEGKRTKIF